MTTPKLNYITEITLSIAFVISLGAAGSVAWENIRNPLFGYFSELSVRITTLWKASLLDSMYQDIGMGFSQNYSISSFYSLHETVFAAFLGAVIIASKILTSKEMMDSSCHPDAAKRAEHFNKHFKRFLNALALMIVALLVFFQVNRLYSEYKNNAVLHIHQAITICSPSISEDETKKLYSEFSSIRTRDDYVKLDANLKNIAKQNNLYFPEFRVF